MKMKSIMKFKKFNKEKFKGFIIGTILTSMISMSIFSFGDGILKTMEVKENGVNLIVNGQKTDSPTYIINGRTYLGLRDIGNIFDKDIGWDGNTSTVTVNDKGFIPSKPVESVTNDDDQSYFFRKVNFGMTRQQVINSEGKKPDVDNGNIIAYYLTIKGIDSDVSYVFNESNELCDVIIESKEKHSNANDYIYDYDMYCEGITEKYGSPTIQRLNWKDDLFKDDTSKYGLAVSAGHLKYFSQWNKDDCKVSCLLTGDNYKISLFFTVTSTVIKQPQVSSGM